MGLYDHTVIESRVDWITLTVKGEVDRIILDRRAQVLLEAAANAGDDVKPLKWFGYEGAQTRHIRYGKRQDSDLIVCSGEAADANLTSLLPLASNVSRLDACVTVHAPDVGNQLVQETFHEAEHWRSPAGHTPAYELRDNTLRGATLYVGSRRSRCYGRLYDKYRESLSDEYLDCWRYELEGKGAMARSIASTLAAHPDRGAACRALVRSYFHEHGCTPIFGHGDDELRITAPRPRTDDISRLLWLERQVSPTVHRLATKGLLSQVESALGVRIPLESDPNRPARCYTGLGRPHRASEPASGVEPC